MGAAVRGGTRSSAKPQAKSPASKAARGGRPVAAAYAPAKLRAGAGAGLAPKLTLIVAGGVLVIGAAVALFSGDRPQTLVHGAESGLAGRFAGLGFRVGALHVQGASAMAQPDIVRASGIYKDQPILGVDLTELRQRILAVGWVKEARVVRLLPDTIVIAVTERPTLAVWQHQGATHVVDAEGKVIPEADPGRFPDLPMVVGDGAAENAAAILPLVRARPRLMERLEALVRVDDRRWDLRMKDGGLIQLPAVGEDSALIQLDQLDQRSRLLELGFARIDLRDPEAVAVRPRDNTPAATVVGGA